MKRLLERLEIEVRLLEALRSTTEEERLALGAGDFQRIQACTERKEKILEAYRSLGISRDHLIERLPGGPAVLAGEMSLQALIRSIGGDFVEPLLEAIGTIQSHGRKLKRTNSVNSVLLQRTCDLMLRARSVLAGGASSEPVYTRRGHFRTASMDATVVREQA